MIRLGKKKRQPRTEYCAVCDHTYLSGTFAEHRKSFAHSAETGHRRAMARWYEANGSRPRKPRWQQWTETHQTMPGANKLLS